MKLVADVGGTNVRFALAEGTRVLHETIQSFRNDDFSDFYKVATTYVNSHPGIPVQSMAFAVAGPVNGTQARLTNRNWDFDTDKLADTFGAPAVLLNDLKALGYSLTELSGESVDSITPHIPGQGDQSLVAGIGTGFNVSPSIVTPRGVVCPDAEHGHTQLSWRLRDTVAAYAGTSDHGYETVEHLFSGRGCEKLWRLGSGSPVTFAHALAGGQDEAVAFAGFYGSLMASLAHDLILSFMPGRGLYFAGGVARAILQCGGADGFREAYAQPLALPTAHHVPVRLILNDHAALSGCAVAAQ